MAEPQLVADCIQAMSENCKIPVTIKTRLGLDDQENYDDLTHFINLNQKAGCQLFILHARNAWLKGLSPKQNRTVPPLKYDWVYRVKKDFPDLHIELNGGVKTIEEAKGHLDHVDSVMIGRAAYENLWMLSKVDESIYLGSNKFKNRTEALEEFTLYLTNRLEKGDKLIDFTKHLNSLFNGVMGSKKWRQLISHCHKNTASWNELLNISSMIESNQK
jgi:tRNA-dihydrouridine synthase A